MEAIIAVLMAGILILISILAIIIRKLDQIKEEHRQEIEMIRSSTQREQSKNTDKQRSVIKGQLAEQFYPLTDRCAYHPSDMRFMGMPIDYLIFDGYTECKDDGGHIREIIFAEIKSGSSQLSRHQREIRDAITSGRVRWETINV